MKIKRPNGIFVEARLAVRDRAERLVLPLGPQGDLILTQQQFLDEVPPQGVEASAAERLELEVWLAASPKALARYVVQSVLRLVKVK